MQRAALVALALLMAPLVGSRVVDGWNWPAKAFVLVYVLFFGTALAYQLIASKMAASAYKAGVGLALVKGFMLGWSTMVQMSEAENPAYSVYFGVLGVGGAGGWLARLEARGMARALFTMAVALAMVEVLAVMLPIEWPPGIEQRIRVAHIIFVALFTASGLLFRHASLTRLRD